jgi:hypothetical protein
MGRFGRDEFRPGAELLDIRTADAAPGDAKLDLALSRWRRRWDLVEPKIAPSMPANRAHLAIIAARATTSDAGPEQRPEASARARPK